jgi:hypothetical protein
MRSQTLTLIIVAAMFSCGPKNTGDIPVLDVTKSYPAKDLVLQDIAGVEYIPLETREGFLTDYFNVKYMDDEIMVTNNNRGDIMIFDRSNGKGITSFNRHGRGPGEYPTPYIHNIAVDKTAGEMFVTMGSHRRGTSYMIYVYDLEGKPLRTLALDRFEFPYFFHSYDGKNLFFVDSENTANPHPYGLISKTDTLVTRLPVQFEGRQTMLVTKTEGNTTYSNSKGDPISKTRDGYMFSEPGVDTMFQWNRVEQTLTPVMTRVPSFGSMEYPIGLFYRVENSDYMFLNTYERKYDFDKREGFASKQLIYDKHSGEFFEGNIRNSDYADERFMPDNTPPAGAPAGVFVFGLQPFELLDLHEQGKLRGRLAEIASTLKEDDNPVMMIVTFK